MMIARGVFSGRNDHFLEGSFTLNRRSDGGVFLETSADFFFDGAPDPAWAYQSGEPSGIADPKVRAAAEASRFGALEPGAAVRGIQRGLLPGGFDITQADHIFLWSFDPRSPRLLGVGPIQRI